jgi:hypothetical protein
MDLVRLVPLADIDWVAAVGFGVGDRLTVR